jgi:TctA family transporter
LIWLLIGVVLGALPGFHPNLALNLPLASGELFQLVLGSIFASAIPAMLMVPTGEMAPVLLPGQAAARKGKIQEAIGRFAGGALLGAMLFFVCYPLYQYVPLVKDALGRLTLPFLVFTTAATVTRSRKPGTALLIFLVSGIYGALILNSGIDSNAVLGAHFSAMFGLAGLFLSKELPEQKVSRPRVVLEFPAAVVGFLGGLLISLFPAITPAQVYAITLLIFGAGARGLSAAGSLASSSFLLSFLSLAYLGKGRMATVEVIRYFSFADLVPYALLAYSAVVLLSRPLVSLVNRAGHLRELMMLAVLASIAVFYVEAAPVALFSFFLGLVPHRLGTERVHLMGSLILPTMLWYL